MKPKSSVYKFLLPLVLIILIAIIGGFLWKGKMNDNQGAALNAIPPISTNCHLVIGPNGMPVAPTPSVTVTGPIANTVYVSGQSVHVTWTMCGISTTAQGTVRLTKISGTGVTSYGPFAVTGSQGSYDIPIAALPGIFDGSSGVQVGIYQATVAYGATSGLSANFIIKYTKTGLEIQFGTQNGPFTGSDSVNHQLTMDIPVTVMAVGHDIYIDKDLFSSVPLTTIGGQIVTFTQGIYNGSNPMTPTNFNSTFVSNPVLQLAATVFGQPAITQVAQTLTNTYLLKAGQKQVLNIHSVVKVSPGSNCVYSKFDQFSFALSDVNGTMSEPLYANFGAGGCFTY
jgi:hypothetical protein